MLPIVYAAAAALAALYWLKKPTTTVPALPPNASLADRVANAIARRDARGLRALATEAPRDARASILAEARRIEQEALARFRASGAPIPARSAATGRGAAPPALSDNPPSTALPPGSPGTAVPSGSGAPEAPARRAALDLTAYLVGLGGLSGRGTENRKTIAAYQTALGVPADGSYGRASAAKVMLQGLVPIVPFSWPKDATKLARAKAQFSELVRRQKAIDPERADAWDALLADIGRA